MQEFAKLVTRDVVKASMNISADTHNEVIDRYIGWVSNAIQKQAGQPIASADVVVTFNAIVCDYERGKYADLYMLPYHPVTAITKVETRPDDFASTFSDATLADYVITRRGGIAYLRARSGYGYGTEYRATLTVGYNDPPGEIARVALEMTVEMLRESTLPGIGKGTLGVDSTTESDSRTGISHTTKLLDMRPEWKEVVMYYAVYESV